MGPLKIVLVTFLWQQLVNGQNVVKMSKFTPSKVVETQNEVEPKPFGFASYYSDHMVLQRAPKRATIWGYAPNIGERIIIKVSERGIYKTMVYEDPVHKYGVWKFKLPAESSAGPFTITAISSTGTVTLTDVMFGDVWLCSGQSNMQFTLDSVYNATEEIADANNFPNIRLFTVANIRSNNPEPDLKGIWENWSRGSAASVSGKTWKYFSAVCWLYGKELYKQLGYPIGLIDTSWGGTPVEVWSSPDSLQKCGLSDTEETEKINKEEMLQVNTDGSELLQTNLPSANSVLWNSMIHPFLNMTIYGAIWYQGEDNTVKNRDKYNCTFPSMIDDWRLKFNQGTEGETDPKFPFGFVQLAPKDPDGPKEGFPEIRWHQTADYGYVPNKRMQNVFMAVALDLPDFSSPKGSVHTRDKQDVGLRLSLSGLSVAYKKQGLHYQGPRPTQIVEGARNITLMYDQTIKFHNLVGFEALCPVINSSITYWADMAVIGFQTSQVTLWYGACGEGTPIIGLRYLWHESPCPFKTCSVYSNAPYVPLPGPPFILYKTLTGRAGTVHQIDWDSPSPIEA